MVGKLGKQAKKGWTVPELYQSHSLDFELHKRLELFCKLYQDCTTKCNQTRMVVDFQIRDCTKRNLSLRPAKRPAQKTKWTATPESVTPSTELSMFKSASLVQVGPEDSQRSPRSAV